MGEGGMVKTGVSIYLLCIIHLKKRNITLSLEFLILFGSYNSSILFLRPFKYTVYNCLACDYSTSVLYLLS